MVYMFKYDSTHGRFKGDLAYKGNQFLVNGKGIAVFTEFELSNLHPCIFHDRALLGKNLRKFPGVNWALITSSNRPEYSPPSTSVKRIFKVERRK